MPIPPRIFIDACVLVAAANSPTGGSSRILQVASEGKVRLVATRLVMFEAKNNIIELLGRPLWPWFARILGPLHISLADPPTTKEKSDWLQITSPKDVPILAGAIKGKADILITLDRKHILKQSVQEAFPIPIMSPGEFLQKYGLVSPTPSEALGKKPHPKKPEE